jgi:GTPase SAR1 family protein
MAGSGKTTFLSRLYRYLTVEKKRDHSTANADKPASSTPIPSEGYYVNLDPAVKSMPFPPQLDIRDTVDYKGVMDSYKLGPNGAIITCLNLFATRFDQVLNILEKKGDELPNLEYIIIDTPGQIESFTWSSSGEIFTQSLAASFPTILTFVVDTPRCVDVNTFMSNMLYACSMLYRSRLPLLVAFNKTDLVSADFAMGWMEDYELFQEAMDKVTEQGESGDGGGYYATLTRSMALTLDEFYNGLKRVGVSAATGEGIEEYFNKVDELKQEFLTDYLPDLEKRTNEQTAKRLAVQKYKDEESLEKLSGDLNDVDRIGGRPARAVRDDEEGEGDEDFDDEDYDVVEDGRGE